MAGCGVVPFRYREQSYVNALQWAIGLEIFLLVRNPWQVVLTTDHPNGGPFTSYPHLIRLLMDRSFREEQLAKLHPEVAANCALRSITRELTLDEIAVMTRAAPARLLGLRDRGQLGVGAAADIAVYREQADREAMFRTPEYVFKDGLLVARAGRVTATPVGGTHFVEPGYDPAIEKTLRRHWDAHGAIRFDHVRDRPRRAVPLLQWRAAAADGVFRGGSVSAPLQRNGVVIDDTFAEAFPMKATRIVITAHTLDMGAPRGGRGDRLRDLGDRLRLRGRHRARARARRRRPTAGRASRCCCSAMSGKELAKQIERRVGQCVLTCPTTAVFAGIAEGEAIALGKNLRFFGDGWQISKVIDGVRYWRVPVMDGEFVAQETTAVVKGVGGGNLLLLARDTDCALAVAEAAVRGDAGAAQRHHAVSRRRGALGLEGRQQVRGARARRPTTRSARACRPGRQERADARDTLRDGDRDRRPDRGRCRRGDARGHACRHRHRRGGRAAAHLGRQLRRQARAVPLPPAQAAGRGGPRMSWRSR